VASRRVVSVKIMQDMYKVSGNVCNDRQHERTNMCASQNHTILVLHVASGLRVLDLLRAAFTDEHSHILALPPLIICMVFKKFTHTHAPWSCL